MTNSKLIMYGKTVSYITGYMHTTIFWSKCCWKWRATLGLKFHIFLHILPAKFNIIEECKGWQLYSWTRISFQSIISWVRVFFFFFFAKRVKVWYMKLQMEVGKQYPARKQVGPAVVYGSLDCSKIKNIKMRTWRGLACRRIGRYVDALFPCEVCGTKDQLQP